MRLKVLKSLNEAYQIGNGVLAFVSGYDLINWLEDREKYSEIRILWDKQQKMWFAGNARNMIHQDILKTAMEYGEYKFPINYIDWFDRSRKIESPSDWGKYYEWCEGLTSLSFAKKDFDSGYFASDGYSTIVYFDKLGASFYFRDDDFNDRFIKSDVYEEAVKRYGKPYIKKI